MRQARWAGMALACVVIAVAVTAGAAEKESKVTLTWEEFKKITGWQGPLVPGGGEVLIPWSDVEQLLDIKIKDVGKASKIKLPWKEFRALVEWSVSKNKDVDKVPPPTDYVITKTTYVGELSKDGATFQLGMEVDILRKKGWKRVQLLPATVGVSDATLPQDAHLNVRGSTYEMLTQATGSKIPVKLTFAAPVAESGGMNTVTFERVPSGTCLLDLALVDKDVKLADVKLQVSGAQRIKAPAAVAGKRMLFALPAGNRVSISWERKIEEVKKGPPKLYAQTQTLVAVGDGVVTCSETVDYSIVHAGVRELSLNVPDGVNILDVSCSSLHDWRVKDKKLAVQLSREVTGVHHLRLTYEKAAPEKGATLDTPVVTTADTERERGTFAVVALANVEISGAPRNGASAVDSAALPPELVGRTSQPVLLGYRYVGKTFSVSLQIEKHEDVKVLVTIVDAATFTVMQTLDGRRIVRAVYDVRNNRNQFLRVKMQDTMKVWSVSVAGKAARPAVDEKKMTLIPLVRSGGQQLTAFPVEIVYIDTAFQPPTKGEGPIRIDLPTCNQPVMNLMCNVYLPKQGKYSSFAGPLKQVPEYKLKSQALQGSRVRILNAQKQAAQLQKQVQSRLRRAAPPGVTPIKVQLPTSGTLFRFQKILVLDGDELWVGLQYTHWPGYSSGFLGIF